MDNNYCGVLTQPRIPSCNVFSDVVLASNADIRQVWSRINSQEFTYGLAGAASGPQSAKSYIFGTPEFEFLGKHLSEAVPLLVQKLNETKGVNAVPSRITYFIACEQCHDARVLPALADYLDTLPDSEEKVATAPFHPFQYAVDAVNAYIAVPPPASGSVFAARHKIAAMARAEFQRRSR